MKILLVTALAIFASAQADDSAQSKARSNGITFTLFTRFNPLTEQILDINDPSSIRNSNFNRFRPTRIVTHGWRTSGSSICVTSVRAAYLTAANYNVIVVDWSSLQGLISNPLAIAREGGAMVAAFINFMRINAQLDIKTTQLVGHSLGAHLLAVAGRTIDGKVDGLFGLDPAGAIWENIGIAKRLGIQPGDADHVQVIHTNGGRMGLMRPAGDSDFYPNGGREQPDCLFDIAGVCSHYRACGFFSESLLNPTAFPTIEDKTVFMGGRKISRHARGIFSLFTEITSPYGEPRTKTLSLTNGEED